MSTADLLRLIAAGDRAAFTRLYADTRPDLTRYAAAMLGGDADAASDVVDEAFLSLWREAGAYRGEGSADGWIRRIVRNKAVDWLRSRRERPTSDAETQRHAALADETDSPEASTEKAQAARRLRAALERLSPSHREVVWLCYFEERSVAEIAVIAGCPENTVKTRLFHARKLLRTELEAG
ncbi:RNA polymerase sigma factor [Phenylobacterium sp. J367]|uniref:RNA polymerase sigma factor n=1 Tax=Phenylobacterium sp. J367 TaxID=2898435 RepID=UPI002151BB9B|nr:sigma-70 family RNA polymerase sigma factor [Phenylobacterium sp. J367]MCR5879655.1 sigma-70 family RNA polymerase sigma factor [Phenylobacterium sp. J367]